LPASGGNYVIFAPLAPPVAVALGLPAVSLSNQPKWRACPELVEGKTLLIK